MAGKTLTVYLAADLKKFNSGLMEAEAGLNGLGGKLTNMLGPALIGAAAAAGAFATKLAIDGVKAAMDEEASVARLDQTLRNLGFGEQSQQVMGFVDSLQYTTTFTDSQMRPAFDRLVRSTHSVEEAQKALQLAMDVAAGTGKDLEAVSTALGKAYDGNTVGLGKLGVGLDKATLASGDLDKITSKMAETFGGQAARQADTLQGRIQILKTGVDELAESFGTGLLSATEDANGSMKDLAQTMKDARPLTEGLGKAVGTLATGYITLITRTLELYRGTGLLNGIVKTTIDLIPGATLVIGLMGNAAGTSASKFNGLRDSIDAAGRSLDAFAGGGGGGGGGGSWGSASGSVIRMTDGMTASQIMFNNHLALGNEHMARFNNNLYETAKAQTSAGGATEKTNPLLEAQTKLIQDSITKLGDEVTALQDATKARNDYANAVAGGILGGVSLKDVFNPDDVQGSIQKFSDALTGATGFSDALTKLGLSLPNSTGAQAFLEQILGLGAEGGQKFLDGLTPQVAENLVTQLEQATTAINGNAYLLANHFYGEGIEAAQQLVDGTIVQIGKEEKRLREIGKNIGKPIGASIKAEIAQAVAEAIKAAEAAKSAAAAEAAAAAAARAATATDQQVADALNRLLTNANARATGTGTVLQ